MYFTGTSAVKVSRKSAQAVSRTIWSEIGILSQSSGLPLIKVFAGVESRAQGRGALRQALGMDCVAMNAKDG